MGMITELLKDKYKLRIPPTVYYDLLADVVEIEEQEPTTKNDLGVDCISREEIKKSVNELIANTDIISNYPGFRKVMYELINDIPSVYPKSEQEPKTDENIHREREQAYMQGYEDASKKYRQEPKTGHWINTGAYYTGAYGTIDYVECSCCHEDSLEEGDYCPNCGARMVEPQESEDK